MDRLRLLPSPGELNFGTVSSGSRTLSLVLENTGPAVVTLGALTITPDDQGFEVESLGRSPFWLRPGRPRAIFVTHTAQASPGANAILRIESNAEPLEVTLVAQ